MVGSDGFAKLSSVRAHGDVVLPDLPVLKVAPECFAESMKGLFSVEKHGDTRKQLRYPPLHQHCNMHKRKEKHFFKIKCVQIGTVAAVDKVKKVAAKVCASLNLNNNQNCN